jgi:hypothetical protein
MDIKRIPHDINGNSRFAIHFSDLLTPLECVSIKTTIDEKYEIALKRSRRRGGRKYHNRSFGGGIAFQAYSESELQKDLENLLK